MSWEERELVSLHDALGGERGHLTYTNHCHAANSHRFGKSRALGFLRSGPSWKFWCRGSDWLAAAWVVIPLAPLGAWCSNEQGQDSLGRRNAASGTPVAAVPRGLGRWLCTNPFCPTFRIAGVPVLSAGPPEIRNLRPCSFLVFFFCKPRSPTTASTFPSIAHPDCCSAFSFFLQCKAISLV